MGEFFICGVLCAGLHNGLALLIARVDEWRQTSLPGVHKNPACSLSRALLTMLNINSDNNLRFVYVVL